MTERVDPGVIERDVKKSAGKGGVYFDFPKGTHLFVPKEETYYLDVIPFRVVSDDSVSNVAKGKLYYKFDYTVHPAVGAREAPMVCPTHFGENCPSCAESKQAWNDGDKELASQFRAKKRTVFNVVDTKSPKKQLMLFDYSQFLFGEKLFDELQADPNMRIFTDLEDGLTIKVRFKKKSKGTYTWFDAVNVSFVERINKYSDAILDMTIDPEQYLIRTSLDDFTAAFVGNADITDVNEEEDAGAVDNAIKERYGKDLPFEKKTSKSDDDDTPPWEEKKAEEPPKRVRRRKPVEKQTPKCPHDGTFGVDNYYLDACPDCDLRKECEDEYNRINEGTDAKN